MWVVFADQRGNIRNADVILSLENEGLWGSLNTMTDQQTRVIARRRDDPAWPRPVFGALPARPYGGAERDRLIQALRQKIGLG